MLLIVGVLILVSSTVAIFAVSPYCIAGYTAGVGCIAWSYILPTSRRTEAHRNGKPRGRHE